MEIGDLRVTVIADKQTDGRTDIVICRGRFAPINIYVFTLAVFCDSLSSVQFRLGRQISILSGIGDLPGYWDLVFLVFSQTINGARNFKTVYIKHSL